MIDLRDQSLQVVGAEACEPGAERRELSLLCRQLLCQVREQAFLFGQMLGLRSRARVGVGHGRPDHAPTGGVGKRVMRSILQPHSSRQKPPRARARPTILLRARRAIRLGLAVARPGRRHGGRAPGRDRPEGPHGALPRRLAGWLAEGEGSELVRSGGVALRASGENPVTLGRSIDWA